jgi:FixJ family two-component response regulator
MKMETCVFIVEDDPILLDALGLIVETAGFSYQSFESAELFLQIYSPHTFGCLLLDVNLPGITGIELQAELLRRKIQLPIIFLSSQDDTAMKISAIKAGAADFLTKPVPSKVLIERIQNALHS